MLEYEDIYAPLTDSELYEMEKNDEHYLEEEMRRCGIILPTWESDLIAECREEEQIAREFDAFWENPIDIVKQQQEEIAYFNSFPPSKGSSDPADRQHER